MNNNYSKPIVINNEIIMSLIENAKINSYWTGIGGSKNESLSKLKNFLSKMYFYAVEFNIKNNVISDEDFNNILKAKCNFEITVNNESLAKLFIYTNQYSRIFFVRNLAIIESKTKVDILSNVLNSNVFKVANRDIAIDFFEKTFKNNLKNPKNKNILIDLLEKISDKNQKPYSLSNSTYCNVFCSTIPFLIKNINDDKDKKKIKIILNNFMEIYTPNKVNIQKLKKEEKFIKNLYGEEELPSKINRIFAGEVFVIEKMEIMEKDLILSKKSKFSSVKKNIEISISNTHSYPPLSINDKKVLIEKSEKKLYVLNVDFEYSIMANRYKTDLTYTKNFFRMLGYTLGQKSHLNYDYMLFSDKESNGKDGNIMFVFENEDEVNKNEKKIVDFLIKIISYIDKLKEVDKKTNWKEQYFRRESVKILNSELEMLNLIKNIDDVVIEKKVNKVFKV